MYIKSVLIKCVCSRLCRWVSGTKRFLCWCRSMWSILWMQRFGGKQIPKLHIIYFYSSLLLSFLNKFFKEESFRFQISYVRTGWCLMKHLFSLPNAHFHFPSAVKEEKSYKRQSLVNNVQGKTDILYMKIRRQETNMIITCYRLPWVQLFVIDINLIRRFQESILSIHHILNMYFNLTGLWQILFLCGRSCKSTNMPRKFNFQPSKRKNRKRPLFHYSWLNLNYIESNFLSKTKSTLSD